MLADTFETNSVRFRCKILNMWNVGSSLWRLGNVQFGRPNHSCAMPHRNGRRTNTFKVVRVTFDIMTSDVTWKVKTSLRKSTQKGNSIRFGYSISLIAIEW